ncbi:MAG: hypothetical protein ACFFCS_22030 [Candidatus Hodarchaeota archaeon]
MQKKAAAVYFFIQDIPCPAKMYNDFTRLYTMWRWNRAGTSFDSFPLLLIHDEI